MPNERSFSFTPDGASPKDFGTIRGKLFYVKAHPANTGLVYIASAGQIKADAYPLSAGQEILLEITDLETMQGYNDNGLDIINVIKARP